MTRRGWDLARGHRGEAIANTTTKRVQNGKVAA
jgi:hypothetical protein